VASTLLIDVCDVLGERVEFRDHKLSFERLDQDDNAGLDHLLELVEIELDVVDPIDGTESLSLDHLQCLYEWLQPGIGS